MKDYKIPIKIFVDIAMLVIMLLEFSSQFTGNVAHEIMGISLTVLFIIHNLLNWRWYASLFKGKYNLNRIIITLINFALVTSMIVTVGSAIPISNTVFAFLNLSGNMEARVVHTASGYWTLVLIAMHLGTHFDMFKGMMKNKLDKKTIKIAIYIIEVLIVIYGIKIFIDFNIYEQLTGYYTFSVWKEGTIISDFLNHTMLLLTISFITHNLLKLVRSDWKKK